MNTYEIGLNAGKVWNLLNEQGEHSLKELREKLKLSNHELFMAIGWLEREGQIFHFEKYERLIYV